MSAIKRSLSVFMHKHNFVFALYYKMWQTAISIDRLFMYSYYRIKGVIGKKADDAGTKLIHICWISGEPYPKPVRKCIRSWYHFLPEYKIMIWDREKTEKIGIQFIADAISAHKYAFAADVVRQYAIHEYGGIYMDSDILLKKRFDEFVTKPNVYFIEHYPEREAYENSHPEMNEEDRCATTVQAAFFIGEKGSGIAEMVLNHYKSIDCNQDAHYEEYFKITADRILAKLMKEHSSFVCEDRLQYLGDDTVVYPSQYLATNLSYDNEDAFAIHMCRGSWMQ